MAVLDFDHRGVYLVASLDQTLFALPPSKSARPPRTFVCRKCGETKTVKDHYSRQLDCCLECLHADYRRRAAELEAMESKEADGGHQI